MQYAKMRNSDVMTKKLQ